MLQKYTQHKIMERTGTDNKRAERLARLAMERLRPLGSIDIDSYKFALASAISGEREAIRRRVLRGNIQSYWQKRRETS